MENGPTANGEMGKALIQFDWVEQLAILQIHQTKFLPADLHMLYNSGQPREGRPSSAQSVAARIGRDPAVWMECFGVFSDITVHFHGRTDPGLQKALRAFKEKIDCTSRAYRWDAVYRLATTYHTKVNRCGRVADAIAWKLSNTEIGTFCKAEDALDQGDPSHRASYASSFLDVRPMKPSEDSDTFDSACSLHPSPVETRQNSIRSSLSNLPLSSTANNLSTASYSMSTSQRPLSCLPPTDMGQHGQSHPTPSRIVNPFVPKNKHDPQFFIPRRRYVADTRPSCSDFNSTRGCKYQQCRYAHRFTQCGGGGHGAIKHTQMDGG